MKSISENIKAVALHKDSCLTILYIVQETDKRGSTQSYLICRCKCGKETKVLKYNAVKGITKSCGCLRSDIASIPKKYSLSVPKLLTCWTNMIKRCYDKSNPQYARYGAIGVIVCDEWRYSYENFLKWALQNGWEEGLQLDKDIKSDGIKIYSPQTCCFVSPMVNGNNKCDTVKFLYKGEMKSLAELSRISGRHGITIKNRIVKYKMSAEEAVRMPRMANVHLFKKKLKDA